MAKRKYLYRTKAKFVGVTRSGKIFRGSTHEAVVRKFHKTKLKGSKERDIALFKKRKRGFTKLGIYTLKKKKGGK